MNWNCFSQTNTNNQLLPRVSDTTKVKLKFDTARLVIKDLIKGEGCETELKLSRDKIIKLESKDVQKDIIISLYDSKDKNNQYIINQLESQIGQYKYLTSDLQKELKKTRLKSFLYKLGTFAGIITTSYLLITK